MSNDLPYHKDMKVKIAGEEISKLLVGGMFLIALMALPVAQHILVTHRLNKEKKIVSSEEITPSFPARNLEVIEKKEITEVDSQCIEQQAEELENLKAERATRQRDLETEYEKAILPYQEVIPVLRGSPELIAQEKEALESLIVAEYRAHAEKLSQLEDELDFQKEELTSRSCLLE